MTILDIDQSRGVPWLNIALLMQILDLFTFLPAVLVWGVGGESNLVMVGVYGYSGLFGVYIAKLVAVAYFILAVKKLDDMGSRLVPLALALIGAIGFLGTMTNVIAVTI